MAYNVCLVCSTIIIIAALSALGEGYLSRKGNLPLYRVMNRNFVMSGGSLYPCIPCSFLFRIDLEIIADSARFNWATFRPSTCQNILFICAVRRLASHPHFRDCSRAPARARLPGPGPCLAKYHSLFWRAQTSDSPLDYR